MCPVVKVRELPKLRLVMPVIVGLVLGGTSLARAGVSTAQASGSLPISYGSSTLTRGTAVDLTVTITNTSSTTPLPGTALPAHLTGSTTVILACTTSACATQLAGTFTFSSCTINDPAITSCTASGTNEVIITTNAASGASSGGVSLLPGEMFHALVTITLI